MSQSDPRCKFFLNSLSDSRLVHSGLACPKWFEYGAARELVLSWTHYRWENRIKQLAFRVAICIIKDCLSFCFYRWQSHVAQILIRVDQVYFLRRRELLLVLT